MPEWDISRLQEDVVTLYLRLNGFMTSAFIVHASQGNLTQVDALAVRFPKHQEPERLVIDDELLQLSDTEIEFAICEVKGKKTALQFNEALQSLDALHKMLRWLGRFSADEIHVLSQQILPLIKPVHPRNPGIISVSGSEKTRLRFYLFAPDRDKPDKNQPFFIGGSDMLAFIAKCLCPNEPRPECATNYGAGQWGGLKPLVAFFKNQPPGVALNMEHLYADQKLRKYYT
jgi:hypothetical protein